MTATTVRGASAAGRVRPARWAAQREPEALVFGE